MMTRWLMDQGIAKPNPFTRLGFSGGAVDDKLPFHVTHLDTIDALLRGGAVKPKLDD